MHIHFVCSGNVFRSRLAEAYLRSKELAGITASSSGTRAGKHPNGPVSWITALLLKIDQLVPFMTESWQQSTTELFEAADLIVFMLPEHYKWAQDVAGYDGDNYEIWGIEDFTTECSSRKFNLCHVIEVERAEGIFSKIKSKVDELVTRLA